MRITWKNAPRHCSGMALFEPAVDEMIDTDLAEDFEVRVRDYIEVLYAVALKLTQDPKAALALAERALDEALRQYGGLSPGAPIKPWLLTILRNTYIGECPKDAGPLSFPRADINAAMRLCAQTA